MSYARMIVLTCFVRCIVKAVPWITNSSKRILCLNGSDQTANRRPAAIAAPAMPGLRIQPFQTPDLERASFSAK